MKSTSKDFGYKEFPFKMSLLSVASRDTKKAKDNTTVSDKCNQNMHYSFSVHTRLFTLH